MVETLDNGKPIKETRDFDVPTAAQHFFYHAGLGRQARPPRPRPGPPAARRRRPGHPVELPAADGGLEDRAGAGRRQHGGDQAGRDHPAVDPGAGRDHRRRRPAARRGQHRHRRRRHRLGPGQPPGRRQGRLHRLDRGGPADPARAGRHRPQAHPRARRQGRQHRLRRRRAGPGGRGHRQRHLLQPGPGLLRRLAAAGAGVGRRGVAGPAQGPGGDAAGRRPDGQEHRRRRDQLRRPARAGSPTWSRPGWPRAPSAWTSSCPLPDRGYYVAPTIFTDAAAVDAGRPRGDLRSGADHA